MTQPADNGANPRVYISDAPPRCADYADGFCGASIDGYCVGGFTPEPGHEPLCHG